MVFPLKSHRELRGTAPGNHNGLKHREGHRDMTTATPGVAVTVVLLGTLRQGLNGAGV